jgi:hypothetical protein
MITLTACAFRALTLAIGLTSTAQVLGSEACKPVLAFKDVQFTEMQPVTLARKWTAVVSVDASTCAANARGSFKIVFMRLKETAPDMEFRERFTWQPPTVTVSVDFASDEAVGSYRIANVTSCACVD